MLYVHRVETHNGQGNLLDASETPYTPKEEAEISEIEMIESTLLVIGRKALGDWTSLTAAQKDAILKGLLRYILHKERR